MRFSCESAFILPFVDISLRLVQALCVNREHGGENRIAQSSSCRRPPPSPSSKVRRVRFSWRAGRRAYACDIKGKRIGNSCCLNLHLYIIMAGGSVWARFAGSIQRILCSAGFSYALPERSPRRTDQTLPRQDSECGGKIKGAVLKLLCFLSALSWPPTCTMHMSLSCVLARRRRTYSFCSLPSSAITNSTEVKRAPGYPHL